VIDDAPAIDHDDSVVLVVSGDAQRAREMIQAVHGRGAKAVLVRRASATLGLAREHRPEAVLLAGDVPRAETVLGQLKNHPDTRHLPVVLIGDPSTRIDGLRAGAAAFIDEPLEAGRLEDTLSQLERLADESVRRIALIAGEGEIEEEISGMLTGSDQIELARIEPETAMQELRDGAFDLGVVVVGRRRGDASRFEFLRDVSTDEVLRERPMIAYVAAKMTKAERARLDALSKGAVITVADSPERLVERAALFLHRVEATLPTPTRKLLGQLRTGDAPLQGKKVLVVDDDIRNVFALTSSLEQRGMKVVYAENGREGIERLHQHPNTDLVLLDIMMPEMDGYETARAIRSMPRFEDLPIISLTAKAMKGDREKAIAAGASDYITKPVDVDQLVSMMRVWLDA
jgi:CheY-like chemotaxis protein